MASSVLLLLLSAAAIAFVSNTCRSEYFLQSLDNLSGVASRWNVGEIDDADSDTLFLGGYIGDLLFIANYETDKMRYAWLHGLQTSQETAVQVWNLATIESNTMLAALAETQSSSESLLLLLSKSSGAPLLPGYKMKHDTSSGITTIKPQRYPMMHWTDAVTLWIVFSCEQTQFTQYVQTRDRSAFVKLRISEMDGTISLVEHMSFPENLMPTTSTWYKNYQQKTYFLIGTTYNPSLSSFKTGLLWVDPENLSTFNHYQYSFYTQSASDYQSFAMISFVIGSTFETTCFYAATFNKGQPLTEGYRRTFLRLRFRTGEFGNLYGKTKSIETYTASPVLETRYEKLIQFQAVGGDVAFALTFRAQSSAVSIIKVYYFDYQISHAEVSSQYYSFADGSSPFSSVSAALKPGTTELVGYWFGSTNPGGQLNSFSPSWTFGQNESIFLTEVTSTGDQDCSTNTAWSWTDISYYSRDLSNGGLQSFVTNYSGLEDIKDQQVLQTEFLSLKRTSIDFSPVVFHERNCDQFSDNSAKVTPGSISTVHYQLNTATFRVPFDSTELGSTPFEFATCNANSRMTIVIDDSAVPNDHSIVYFDSSSQEFVFVGGQSPAVGTYEIKVTANLRAATRFISSTFTFDLVVVDPSLQEEDSISTETQLTQVCDQSSAVLVGLPTTKTFAVTSGQLLFANLAFSDNRNGECLAEWLFVFYGSDEQDPQVSFNPSTKSLTFFTARTDLHEFSASLKVVRSNNELIQETTFTFEIEVLASENETDGAEAIAVEIANKSSDESSENSVSTKPASSAPTVGNPNSPTLTKAGSLNGLTIDVSKLTSDFIELGSASDLDGDTVSVSWEISPSTNLITFDEGSNFIDLSLEKLFELTLKSGPKLFEVQVKAMDGNMEPRYTTYIFKIKVPQLSQSEIGEFYAALIHERLNSAAEEENDEVTIPYLSKIEVTNTGQAFVCFTEEILNQLPESVTKDALQVTLIPYGGNKLTKEKSFTWRCSKFTSKCLELELTFNAPLSISSQGPSKRDMLEVRVKNPFLFKAKTSMEVVPRGDMETAPIPQQISSGQAESLDTMMEAVRKGTKTTLFGTIILLLFTGGLSEMWGWINSIQMLAFIQYMHLYMPTNAELFFSFMLKVADFEIIDSAEAYGWLFDLLIFFDPNERLFSHEGIEEARRRLQRKKASRTNGGSEDQENNGDRVDSETFVERFGPMIYTFIFLILLALVLLVMFIWAKIDPSYESWWLQLRNAVFWNVSLRIFIEGYLSTAYELLQKSQRGFTWEHPAFVVMNLFELICLLLTILLPPLIYYLLRKRTSEFRTKAFKDRYGDSVENLTDRRQNSPIYLLLFCVMRLLIATFLVYFTEAWLQVTSTILVIQTTIIVQGHVEPFRYASQRRIEYFNQVITLLWCYFMYIFTDFVPDAETRYLMGYPLIAIVSFCFLVNLIYVNSDMPYKLKKKYRKWKEKRNRKNQKKQKKSVQRVLVKERKREHRIDLEKNPAIQKPDVPNEAHNHAVSNAKLLGRPTMHIDSDPFLARDTSGVKQPTIQTVKQNPGREPGVSMEREQVYGGETQMRNNSKSPGGTEITRYQLTSVSSTAQLLPMSGATAQQPLVRKVSMYTNQGLILAKTKQVILQTQQMRQNQIKKEEQFINKMQTMIKQIEAQQPGPRGTQL